MSNFSCSLTRNITSHSMENLAFYSLLRREMIIRPILTTSLIHCLLKMFRECMYFLGLGMKRLTKSKAGPTSPTKESLFEPFPLVFLGAFQGRGIAVELHLATG